MRAGGFKVRVGERWPPGATTAPDGVNFSVFSRGATAMSLLLYGGARDREPLDTIRLDPVLNRTFFFWHVFVEGARPGLYYTWKAEGPADTRSTGFRFDSRRELLDPWARSVSDAGWDRKRAIGDPARAYSFRAEVVDLGSYDWEGDRGIDHRFEDSVIYELHVGGFTRHPTSAVSRPGGFRALVEKIPYLLELGITDVELMPVMAFDPQDVPASTADRGLVNYWGYSPYGFFAPHPHYAAEAEGIGEFRDMVKALHRAGLGVILDVVFNHTAEGNGDGPPIHFRGLANETFYHLDPSDRRRYLDYTGCGNTLNCNHPFVADFLIRCLEYWVQEMHVDGFRFDLASVLGRGEDGEPMGHAPLLWAIELSPVLAHTKLIAEAWDAGGLDQVGDFPGLRWMEWNGRYRDSIRKAVRGERGLARELATRVCGSSDLYGNGKLPINSVNYVTCHDGFTLWDLVSYERKHNEANGEGNRDGPTENFGWNCGVEGPTEDADILHLRRRQARNFVVLLLLSQGLPMLLAGDEVLRTQGGNNNPYCQDNEIGWFDWSLVETNRSMFRFTQHMIGLRKRHRALRRTRFLTGKPGTGLGGQADIVWHGERLNRPNWSASAPPVFAFTLAAQEAGEADLHVMINLSDRSRTMAIPPRISRKWSRAVDTGLDPPEDILPPGRQQPVAARGYRVRAHSVVVLESETVSEPPPSPIP